MSDSEFSTRQFHYCLALLIVSVGLNIASNVTTNYQFQLERYTKMGTGATQLSIIQPRATSVASATQRTASTSTSTTSTTNSTTPTTAATPTITYLEDKTNLTLLTCAMHCASNDQCNMFEIENTMAWCTLYSERIFDLRVHLIPHTNTHVGYKFNYDYITDGKWTLVFRAQENLNLSVYDTWDRTGLVHDNPIPSGFPLECVGMRYSSRCNQIFRSSILDRWNDINEVKYSLWSVGEEVVFVEFNGVGTNRDSWFSQAFFMSSTWGYSLPSLAYMGVRGFFYPPNTARRFNMNEFITPNCSDQKVYSTVIDLMTDDCSQDFPIPIGSGFPIFVYSPLTVEAYLSDIGGSTGVLTADVLAVWVSFN